MAKSPSVRRNLDSCLLMWRSASSKNPTTSSPAENQQTTTLVVWSSALGLLGRPRGVRAASRPLDPRLCALPRQARHVHLKHESRSVNEKDHLLSPDHAAERDLFLGGPWPCQSPQMKSHLARQGLHRRPQSDGRTLSTSMLTKRSVQTCASQIGTWAGAV